MQCQFRYDLDAGVDVHVDSELVDLLERVRPGAQHKQQRLATVAVLKARSGQRNNTFSNCILVSLTPVLPLVWAV